MPCLCYFSLKREEKNPLPPSPFTRKDLLLWSPTVFSFSRCVSLCLSSSLCCTCWLITNRMSSCNKMIGSDRKKQYSACVWNYRVLQGWVLYFWRLARKLTRSQYSFFLTRFQTKNSRNPLTLSWGNQKFSHANLFPGFRMTHSHGTLV